MTHILVNFDDSPTGSGKTARIIRRLARKPIRAIYCSERIVTATEIQAAIDREALRYRTVPIFRIINSDLGYVSAQIKQVQDATASFPHVIIFLTHAALEKDLGGFEDFSIVIDEIPKFVDSKTLNTKLTLDHYRRAYRLEPIDSQWSKVSLTDYGRSLSVTDIRNDTNLSGSETHKFHEHILASHSSYKTVIVRGIDWDVIGKDEWFWTSFNSMRNFATFNDVTILANRCMEACQIKMIQKADEKFAAPGDLPIVWKPVSCIPRKTPAVKPRKVTIRYYCEQHLSKTYLESAAGHAALNNIGADLAKRGEMIWSANNSSRKGETPSAILSKHLTSRYLKPRQAGSNEFRHYHEAAIIFAGNPSTQIEGLLAFLGIDKKSWQASVEHETILQFVTRTSIRDAHSSADVTFTVFDRDDADYVANYLRGLGHDVSVIYVDLGIVIRRKPAGRIKLPEEERIARRKETKRKSKAKAKATSTKRPAKVSRPKLTPEERKARRAETRRKSKAKAKDALLVKKAKGPDQA